MIAKTYPRPNVRVTAEEIKEKYNLETVYLMHQNESPYGPSPAVLEAIQKEAASLNYYPSMSDGALRDTLAEVLGRGLTRDNFWTGCSGYETIELLARAYLGAEDEVIITPPTFGAYNKMIGLQDSQIVQVPLTGPTFVPNVDAILAAITEKTKLVLLCNPGNPTGSILVAAEMDRLVNALPDRVILVSDDVYHQFVRNTEYPDSIQYVVDGKNVVLIHTFSKAYGMAGVRVGYGIAKPEIANHIGGMHRGFHHNRLGMAAAIAAANDQVYLQETVNKLLDGKKWICEQLDELDIAYIPSETNFILMDVGRPSQIVTEALYAYGVITRPQSGDLENYLRVTVSTPEGNAQFIKGLKAIL
mgnify:CR=1 FL=1